MFRCDGRNGRSLVVAIEPTQWTGFRLERANTARAALSKWQAPGTFRAAVTDLHSRAGSAEFFNRPHLSFLRDGWVIAEFLTHLPALRVRLSTENERWPDGFIETEHETLRVEVTEALEPGRRRGDEFKPGAPRVTHDPVEDWVARAAIIPDALEKAVSDKSR